MSDMSNFEKNYYPQYYYDFCDSDSDDPETDATNKIKSLVEHAITNPETDFFQENPTNKPKKVIGQYVASQGFNVPLIESEDEWREAYDQGLAFIRSERVDDYDGMSGILESKRVSRERVLEQSNNLLRRYPERLMELTHQMLRNSELDPDDYIDLFVWGSMKTYMQRRASNYRLPIDIEYGNSTSLWRYVSGTNIRIFRDPNVDQKYHLGICPDRGYIMGYEVEGDSMYSAIDQERSSTPIEVSKLVDFYEQIRNLPLFDVTQAPLLEIKQDDEGELHFLQYFRTGQKMNYTEPFSLPSGENVIRTSNVRGATYPSGEKMRLYISPNYYTPRMDKQGFYFDMLYHEELLEQYLCSIGRVAVHEAYIGLKDNHFSSSPVFRPQVGMGLIGISSGVEQSRFLRDASRDRYHEYDSNAYINVVITANGREATIASDWQLHEER